MDAKNRVFVTSAQAAFFLTVTSWAFVLLFLRFAPAAPTHRGISIAVAVVLPDALATRWIFRRLRSHRSRDNARRAATAFAISAPAALAVSYPLSELVGGYAEWILGSRFILPTIFGFILLVMILVPGVIVAWALHPSAGIGAVVESEESRK
jgi:MFS family permease